MRRLLCLRGFKLSCIDMADIGSTILSVPDFDLNYQNNTVWHLHCVSILLPYKAAFFLRLIVYCQSRYSLVIYSDFFNLESIVAIEPIIV